jgi:RNA-directed DNA polymerase
MVISYPGPHRSMDRILRSLSVEKLQRIIGISESDFYGLARFAPKLYRHEKLIHIESGKTRKIQIPHPALKRIQKRILDKILICIPTHPCVFGKPGSSIKDAVGTHVQQDMVITMDIRDFFPSVSKNRIIRALIKYGATQHVAHVLTRLVTHEKRLPQGAPTSPCIGRIIITSFAEDLEKVINNYAAASFSIYFDDITISGPNQITKIIDDAYPLLEKHGFEAKKSKTHIMDREKEQISLSIKLNERIEATDKFRREIEELMNKVPASDPVLKGKIGWRSFLERPD